MGKAEYNYLSSYPELTLYACEKCDKILNVNKKKKIIGKKI